MKSNKNNTLTNKSLLVFKLYAFLFSVCVFLICYELNIFNNSISIKLQWINPKYYINYVWDKLFKREKTDQIEYTNEYIRKRSINFLETYSIESNDVIDEFDINKSNL